MQHGYILNVQNKMQGKNTALHEQVLGGEPSYNLNTGQVLFHQVAYLIVHVAMTTVAL